MTFDLTLTRLIAQLLVLVSTLLYRPAFADPLPKLDEKRLGYIHVVLASSDTKFEWAQLKEDGEEVLPYIAQILTDPVSDRALERAFIFANQNLTKYDCKRLVEPTVAHLTHHRWEIKAEAMMLLEKIGSRAECTPVAMLLYAENKHNRMGAASCLEKLGGKRELLALDLWLRDPTRLKDEAFDEVKKSRNALRTRVEAEEKAKTEAAPKAPAVEKK